MKRHCKSSLPLHRCKQLALQPDSIKYRHSSNLTPLCHRCFPSSLRLLSQQAKWKHKCIVKETTMISAQCVSLHNTVILAHLVSSASIDAPSTDTLSNSSPGFMSDARASAVTTSSTKRSLGPTSHAIRFRLMKNEHISQNHRGKCRKRNWKGERMTGCMTVFSRSTIRCLTARGLVFLMNV